MKTLKKPIAAASPAKALRPAGAQVARLVATITDLRLVLDVTAPAQAVARLMLVGWKLDAADSGQAKDVNCGLLSSTRW